MSKPHNVPDETPYRDKETLKRLYEDEGLYTTDIAEKFSVSSTTIQDWMERHGIDRKETQEAQTESLRKSPAGHYWREDGYEISSCEFLGETDYFGIHRLAAVAWFGWDAVEGKVIHHKNGIRWDNRESNLEPMTDSDHKSHHAKEINKRRWSDS